MSIRGKTIAVVLLVMGAAFGLLGVLLAGNVQREFARLELREAGRNMERVTESFEASVAALCTKLSDWAVWDDAYAFVADGNRAFVESNVVETTFTGMKVDLMLFHGADGGLRFGQAFDAERRLEAPLPAALLAARFGPASPLLPRGDADAPRHGILQAEGQRPLVFCAQPILTSEGAGPARGTLVFGAWLDAEREEALRKLTRLDLEFTPVRGEGAAAPPRLQVESDDLLAGYVSFPDPGGGAALRVRAALPREIHAEARRTVRTVLLVLASVGLLFALTTVALLEWLVVRRLAAMSSAVNGITQRFEFERRVDDSGSDEISRMGRSVNGLLAAMEQAMHAGESHGR